MLQLIFDRLQELAKTYVMRQSQLVAQPVAFGINTLVVRVIEENAYLLRGEVESLHAANIDVVLVEARIDFALKAR